MNTLYVFFDQRCGICRRFKEWLNTPPQVIPIQCHGYQTPEARELCPNLMDHDPERELVAMADTGEIFQGARAWVACLKALENHQALAQKLDHPRWMGLTKRVCRLVSENRLGLSKLLFRNDREFLAEFEAAETANPNTCTDEACHLS